MYLFDFLNDVSAQDLKIMIGVYLRRNKIVYNWHGDLLSVNELNMLNRKLLAKRFVEQYRETLAGIEHTREFSKEELINTISQYIDLSLPKLYFIEKNIVEHGEKLDRRGVQKLYRGITSIKGAIYVYKRNYQLQKDIFARKKKYRNREGVYIKFKNEALHEILLNELDNAGMELIKADLKRSEMIRLLRFFHNDKPIKKLFTYVEYKI